MTEGMKKSRESVHRSEGIWDYVRERDQKNFSAIYPDIDMDTKIVLWVQPRMYADFTLSKNIACTVTIINKARLSKYHSYDLRVRHPWPNKNLLIGCNTHKNRVNDIGLILAFDSFEELEQIQNINVSWAVEDKVNYSVTQIVPVSFARKDDFRHFSIEIEAPTYAIQMLRWKTDEERDTFYDSIESEKIAANCEEIRINIPSENGEEVYIDVKGEAEPLAMLKLMISAVPANCRTQNESNSIIECIKYKPQEIVADRFSSFLI